MLMSLSAGIHKQPRPDWSNNALLSFKALISSQAALHRSIPQKDAFCPPIPPRQDRGRTTIAVAILWPPVLKFTSP